MNCINCKNNKLKKIITIGKQPISSIFFDKKKFNLKKYSLDLYQCLDCKLVQLKNFSNFSDIYKSDYGYKTSISPSMVAHMKEKYRRFLPNNSKKVNILDIGSNDGTFLNFFSNKKNLNLYGVDPSAKNFINNYNSRVNLLVDFFSIDKFKNFLKNKNNIKFSLITSFAMFYDVTNPNKFCSDIEKLLDDNGIWVCELSYFPLLLKNLTYDQICHEHVAYYTLSTFKSIVTKNGLKILDCNLNKINGGSIEIICAKKKSFIKSQDKKIENIIKDENLISEKSYKKFNIRINNIKILLNNFLLNLSQKKVFAYGASTKGNVVLNHCNITYKKIKYVCDDNFSKIGKYTPGSNIKIISKNLMRKLSPQYLLVLIWPFKSEVIKQEIKFIKNGGKLIFHLPALHIVDKKNYKSYLDNDLSLFSYGY